MLASVYSTSNCLHRTRLSRFLKADRPGQDRFPAGWRGKASQLILVAKAAQEQESLRSERGPAPFRKGS
jgi:hypothetical protein